MSKHLRRDLDRLKKEILTVGSLVEEAINKAILALIDRRPDIAERVMEGDSEIDEKEVDVEEDCLKILALHQPVAFDLRFIIAVLKVNNDLERMGDLAANIAERADFLANHEPLPITVEHEALVEQVRDMVRESLEALVNLDTDLARKVLNDDHVVDEGHRQMFEVVQELIRENPETLERAINVLSASRNLERIADLATNIAEDVIFMVEGEVIRHARKTWDERGGWIPAVKT